MVASKNKVWVIVASTSDFVCSCFSTCWSGFLAIRVAAVWDVHSEMTFSENIHHRLGFKFVLSCFPCVPSVSPSAPHPIISSVCIWACVVPSLFAGLFVSIHVSPVLQGLASSLCSRWFSVFSSVLYLSLFIFSFHLSFSAFCLLLLAFWFLKFEFHIGHQLTEPRFLFWTCLPPCVNIMVSLYEGICMTQLLQLLSVKITLELIKQKGDIVISLNSMSWWTWNLI